MRKLRFKEREWFSPVAELWAQLGLEFRCLGWQSYCFYYAILLLLRWFIDSSERNIIFLGRKYLLLKNKDLFVLEGESWSIHGLVLNTCVVKF